MANELKVIRQEEVLGKDFKIYGSVDRPLFLAKDVAEWIDHTHTTKMLKTIDEDEKLNGTLVHAGQNREMIFLTEDGLYEVLMQSRKLIAKKLKKKVKEILKTIRKTGGYVANADAMVETYFGSLPETHKGIVKGLFLNIEEQQKQIQLLSDENVILVEEKLEWADRNLINSIVRRYAGSFVFGNQFGLAWNEFKSELLYKHGINIESRITKYKQRTGKKTNPKTLDMLKDKEIPKALSTIVALCREKNINIDDLLENKKKEAM